MKPVTTKWRTDGDLAVIYRVDDLLLFYSTSNDPKFKKGEKIDKTTAINSNPYKTIQFSMDNVPNDAYIDLNFSWSGQE